MKSLFKTICAVLTALTVFSFNSFAQSVVEGKVQFDKTVHDFGDIYVNDGAVSHEFTVKNVSDKAIIILNVVSSCGCTAVEWTKEPIAPGKSGKVKATYDNSDGPYPFDKTVSVYVSDLKKPVVLHLRGSVHEVSKPLKERYSLMLGNFGVKSLEFDAGNLSIGDTKTVSFVIANNGVQPMDLKFKNISDGMKLAVYPNPVPAMSTATLEVTITADHSRYGRNWYYATPVVDGREYKAVGKLPAKEDEGNGIYTTPNTRLGLGKNEIGIVATTKERYFETTEGNKAPNLTFNKSTENFGKVKAGTKKTITFNYSNSGKTATKLYRLDSSADNVSVKELNCAPAGKKGYVTVELDTYGMPAGEHIIVLNLYTNAPLRPVITLQLVGEII